MGHPCHPCEAMCPGGRQNVHPRNSPRTFLEAEARGCSGDAGPPPKGVLTGSLIENTNIQKKKKNLSFGHFSWISWKTQQGT